MASFDVLGRNNSHLIRLTGLVGPNSSTIDSSTGVTATLYNAAGDEVSGGSTWPISLTATSSATNDYQVSFSSTGFALTNQESCECRVTVNHAGTVAEFVRPLRFLPRTV